MHQFRYRADRSGAGRAEPSGGLSGCRRAAIRTLPRRLAGNGQCRYRGFSRRAGLAASALAKEDHAALVEMLEQEGYFSIRNLVPYLARLLGISRATVYKHLREARQKKLQTTNA
ncbi:helix-turn-helix domain-containing protein [Rhizobium sp. RCAM05973]|uniref:helix-turn-helix domain-containing protein n=1 Tax=Rhizobium sp. RCAM05973 TaxID=2994066 RepID=UPI0022EC029A|nr:helix-turn-helix domain-containing protein [Rhizobium sp. RCAM05973]